MYINPDPSYTAEVHRTGRATINLRDPKAGGARGRWRQWKSPEASNPPGSQKIFIKIIYN